MILADRFSEFFGQSRLMIEPARKLVVHRDLWDMALALAIDPKKVERVAPYTCFPDYTTWVEISSPEGNIAFLFDGELTADEPSMTKGIGFLITEKLGEDTIGFIPLSIDVEHYRMSYLDVRTRVDPILAALSPAERMKAELEWGKRGYDRDPVEAKAIAEPVIRVWKPVLYAVLALINSPKIVTTREVDVSRLNKSRLKKGKYPFHPHHEIRINVDTTRVHVTPPTGAGPEREQYFVRAHPMFFVHPRYKNVSVVMRRPHYRGNPELGMRNTSYAAAKKGSTFPRE